MLGNIGGLIASIVKRFLDQRNGQEQGARMNKKEKQFSLARDRVKRKFLSISTRLLPEKRQSHRARLIIALLCLTCGTLAGFASIYYVATNGNDGDAGTLAAPWKTPQKAAKTLVAGDTVYVRRGVYPGAVVAANSGAPNLWITYAAYTNETPTLDGQGIVPAGSWGGVFSIYGQRFIRVEGFRFIRSAYAGILAEQSGDLLIRRNQTSNTWSSGIATWNCTNVVIESNEVQWACQGNGALQECVTVSGTENFVVRSNRVRDRPVETGNGGEGICVKDACRHGRVENNTVYNLYRLGIYVDAEASLLTDIAVSVNLVHDCAYGVVLASEVGGLVSDVRVFNNVLYSNRFIGIEIADIAADGPRSDIHVYNNTLVGNGHTGLWGGGIAISSRNPLNRRFVVHNNLCSDNLNWQIATVPMAKNLTVSHNLLDAFQGWVDGEFVELTGANAIIGPPRFILAAAANYRLKPGSPAIDVGLTAETAPLSDFDGRPRPSDGNADGTAAMDVGAFEFAPPRIRQLTVSGGVPRLTWESVTGATYAIQFSPMITPPTWSNLPLNFTATGAMMDVQDPAALNTPRRFYRVQALE